MTYNQKFLLVMAAVLALIATLAVVWQQRDDARSEVEWHQTMELWDSEC